MPHINIAMYLIDHSNLILDRNLQLPLESRPRWDQEESIQEKISSVVLQRLRLVLFRISETECDGRVLGKCQPIGAPLQLVPTRSIFPYIFL